MRDRSPVGSEEGPLEYSASDKVNRSQSQQRENRVKPVVEEIARTMILCLFGDKPLLPLLYHLVESKVLKGKLSNGVPTITMNSFGEVQIMDSTR